MVTPPISDPAMGQLPFNPAAGPPVNSGMAAPPNPFGAPSPTEDFDTEFEADLSEADLLPEGYYKMKVIDVTQEISQKGDPMYTWSMAVIEGEYSGRQFRMWTSLTAAAIWKLTETLVSLGLGRPGEKARFRRSDAINRVCTAEIVQELYRDRMQNSIKSIAPAPEGVGYKAPALGIPDRDLPF